MNLEVVDGLSRLESVWDYPRPPRVQRAKNAFSISALGIEIVKAEDAIRVLETSHPPVYYFNPSNVRVDVLVPTNYKTGCEWKGVASYFDIRIAGNVIQNGAWCYKTPHKKFDLIKDYLAFYPSKMDSCCIGGEQASAQAGDFYGGWITKNITGPFKGEPGTRDW